MTMARLLVHVEGQTEESFVNELLRAHLLLYGYEAVSARIMGNARLRRRRGGIRSWPTVKRDIVSHLREDLHCVATTMVDFYGLPQAGAGAWPGRAEASHLQFTEKAEGLLFSDCAAFAQGIGQPLLESELKDIRDKFDSPEEINDSSLTAPSKRVEELIPRYEKPFLGTLAALEIGLDRIRNECAHFNEWLIKLESLPAVKGG